MIADIHTHARTLRRAIDVRRLIEDARTEDGHPKSENTREALNAARHFADWVVADLTEQLLDALDALDQQDTEI